MSTQESTDIYEEKDLSESEKENREKMSIGHKCKVYSTSENKWFNGKITEMDGSKDVYVEYQKAKSTSGKWLDRYSKHIKDIRRTSSKHKRRGSVM